MKFLHSLQSELLKTRRSAALWLSLAGGFFIPIILLIASLKDHQSINSNNDGQFVWHNYFMNVWSMMIGFLLPLGIILATSLIAQIEYKNNSWKQLYTTPQTFSMIFFSKLTVILLMTMQFFIFFNIGIFLSAAIPCLLFDKHLPKPEIPLLFFLKENFKFFMTCLPIIAIQYLLSLKFKNFLVPVGIGALSLIGTLIAFRWKYIFLSPFSYGQMSMITKKKESLSINVYVLAICFFVLIMIINYFLYINKKEKG